MDPNYFWTGWSPVWHTLVIATFGYLGLVLLLRGTGPRTMARMTPLDFIIGVTIGSTFGRAITALEVSLAQALAALLLLVAVHWLLNASRVRWKPMRRLLDASPVLLYYDGQLQRKVLRRSRLSEVDVHAAARQSGYGSLADIQAVILQQDGTLGVIAKASMGDGSSVLPFVELPPTDPDGAR